MTEPVDKELASIRSFYESVYYKDIPPPKPLTSYHRRLARRLKVGAGDKVLDVACGLGEWLRACAEHGALPHGIDLSERAIQACRQALPQGQFLAQPAEQLPFPDDTFDLVTCLGSLEHFVDPVNALREMARTAKPNAPILIVVPNTEFIARRIGLYRGTQQTAAKEVPRSPTEWKQLFQRAGLTPVGEWSDLHMLSWSWISQSGLAKVPLRAAIALALSVIPVHWQYQISYHCIKA